MASKRRVISLGAALSASIASVFAYDAARNDLWANATVGLVVCVGLLVVISAYAGRPDRIAQSPDRSLFPELQWLRTILDQTPIPLVSCSPGSAPQAVNRAARSLFRTDDDIFSHGDHLRDVMTGPAAGGRPILEVNGRSYALNLSEVITDENNIRLATLTDVQTEIHKAEAAGLRDTLHILSHEIMNSLTPVSSLADIANSYLSEETGPAALSAREALDTLCRRARSLTRFIEAYRTVARLPQPTLMPVNPVRLVQDIVALFQRDATLHGIEFLLDIGETSPRIAIDEPQISQALINLLTNAVEAIADIEFPRRVSISLRQADQELVILVSDNGPGVPSEIKLNLFVAFATTKAKGTGTGLNLARQIALAHGGNLQLLDDDGTWPTTFALSLPLLC